MHLTLGPAIAAVLMTLSAATPAQTAQLAPQAQRISDAVVQADHAAYETLQLRIKGINDKGRLVRDYHLSKAQCWLDVSLHEYTRNDRSAFPQAAMTESEKLVQRMELAPDAKPLNGPWDTPLVNQAARLRPDLWARADALKGHAGIACAAQRTACAEVELVHAGNEFNQQQWRHAKPYVQIAEDQLAEAEALAQSCLPPPAPAPAPVAVVTPPLPAGPRAPTPAAAASAAVQLSASVLFNFDRFTADQMLPESRAELDALAHQLQSGMRVEAVKLVGHADRLNSTGSARYNQQLSEKRARSVRNLLIGLGVSPSQIGFEYRGASEPVAACSGTFKHPRALEQCLLPNRRVEVRITGVR